MIKKLKSSHSVQFCTRTKLYHEIYFTAHFFYYNLYSAVRQDLISLLGFLYTDIDQKRNSLRKYILDFIGHWEMHVKSLFQGTFNKICYRNNSIQPSESEIKFYFLKSVQYLLQARKENIFSSSNLFSVTKLSNIPITNYYFLSSIKSTNKKL